MSRKTTEWRRKIAQKGMTTKEGIRMALLAMFPTRNVRTEGRKRAYDSARDRMGKHGVKPAPGREICTRPMSQDKQERIIRSCGGFVLPMVLFAVVIMSMIAATMLHIGMDELAASRAYRLGYKAMIQDESRVNRAIGLAGPVMDSLMAKSVPGIPFRFAGVDVTRYSLNPNLYTDSTGTLQLSNIEQVVGFRYGRIEITVSGNPGMWVPGLDPDDPNPDHDPNENAWVCVWPNESKCWNSPNFHAHWLDSRWVLTPRSRREDW